MSKKIYLQALRNLGFFNAFLGGCGRHTFATMCLTYEIPITTIAKLLGHKDIKHTQVYAKLVDKKKDEAIDKLPEL